jgi:hypothetical protein
MARLSIPEMVFVLKLRAYSGNDFKKKEEKPFFFFFFLIVEDRKLFDTHNSLWMWHQREIFKTKE